jgi:SAM-dependent methyltransferase
MPDDGYLARVRARLASGELSDIAFDALLPPVTRAKARAHWTPIAVARRVALRFAERGATRVLDVGSGPGKFCVAAAVACSELDFCGIEHSVALTRTAKELAARLCLSNVEFRSGDALGAPWHDFDGFYFFNPFAESSLAPASICRRLAGQSELALTLELLAAARRGVTVITYHGLGGPIPSSYDLVSEEAVGSGRVRVWTKARSRDSGWFYLDDSRAVLRLTRRGLEERLGIRKPWTELAPE